MVPLLMILLVIIIMELLMGELFTQRIVLWAHMPYLSMGLMIVLFAQAILRFGPMISVSRSG